MTTHQDTVGVIVARFQVPELHAGHRYLIETVLRQHKDVLIFLGTTAAQLTRNNPLSADVRRLMLQNQYPGVVLCELQDMRSDKAWSRSSIR